MSLKILNLKTLNYYFAISFLVSLIICISYADENPTSTTPFDGEVDNGNSTLLESNDPNKVGFYLYPNPENLSDYDQIYYGDKDSLINSRYNARNPCIFLIHGFLNNYTTRFSQRVKNEFLKEGYASRENVFVVDWGHLSSPANQTAWAISHINDLNKDLFYQAAVANVPRVGNRVAQFISFLIDQKYLSSPADVHLIGFSLGAQISGFAGSYTKQNGKLIGRITGLDPASPLYQTATSDNKLESSDASFVDVVHSNQGQDGYYGNIGHADFYPNGGGPNQPDCLDSIGVGVVESTISGTCAHNRAWLYYIKSLTEQITACKCLSQADVLCKAFCSNKAIFGHLCPPTARGSYYFDISIKEQ